MEDILTAYPKTYSKDKRTPIEKLYHSFYNLSKNKAWKLSVIDKHIIKHENKKLVFPLISLTTKTKGKAIWLISGIHGEESAGPIALAKSLGSFKSLAEKGIPFVILPLCNPSGYFRNWRYLFHAKDWKIGRSIGDCEHVLVNSKNKPRTRFKPLKQTQKFVDEVLKLIKEYPPLFVIDLHEDDPNTAEGDPYYGKEDNKTTYVYSQGKLGHQDPIAKEVIRILKKHKHPLESSGRVASAAKERIINGIVCNMKDSSIDELLASEKVYEKNKIIKKFPADSVVIIETLTTVPLGKRLKIHMEILASLKKFISLEKS
ncbi:MAG: hypothetical protein WC238_05980 [Parcubacteria group bacterium]|jgi:hypothetical protein